MAKETKVVEVKNVTKREGNDIDRAFTTIFKMIYVDEESKGEIKYMITRDFLGFTLMTKEEVETYFYQKFNEAKFMRENRIEEIKKMFQEYHKNIETTEGMKLAEYLIGDEINIITWMYIYYDDKKIRAFITDYISYINSYSFMCRLKEANKAGIKDLMGTLLNNIWSKILFQHKLFNGNNMIDVNNEVKKILHLDEEGYILLDKISEDVCCQNRLLDEDVEEFVKKLTIDLEKNENKEEVLNHLLLKLEGVKMALNACGTA